MAGRSCTSRPNPKPPDRMSRETVREERERKRKEDIVHEERVRYSSFPCAARWVCVPVVLPNIAVGPLCSSGHFLPPHSSSEQGEANGGQDATLDHAKSKFAGNCTCLSYLILIDLKGTRRKEMRKCQVGLSVRNSFPWRSNRFAMCCSPCADVRCSCADALSSLGKIR